MSRKITLFLYTNGNMLRSLLGLLGLLLFFVGLIKSFWFFIVLGLYGVGYVLAPKNRAVEFKFSQDIGIDELKKSLKNLLKEVKKRVSLPVLTRINSIVESIDSLLPHLSKIENSHHNLHVIKQTATDYLPQMLNTYLSLPTAFARFHHVKGNQTPRDILIEQLDILDKEMKQILIDVHKQDTEALLTHGRFLKDKFSSGNNWIN